MATPFKKNQKILFQGDSITDAGRKRDDAHSLGGGYAKLAAGWLMALYPELGLRFINRGISGNRTKDLLKRWEADCLAIQPDILTIMIGINNTWRRYDRNDPTPVEQFEDEYRQILDRTKKETGARIVLIEPFVLPHPEDRKTWREDLDPKIEVVNRLAKEFGALLIPLDAIFAEACKRQQPAYWAPDGVHPTLAGHAFIAQTWIRYVESPTT
jgi:acyl-CoA thioesterase-1